MTSGKVYVSTRQMTRPARANRALATLGAVVTLVRAVALNPTVPCADAGIGHRARYAFAPGCSPC